MAQLDDTSDTPQEQHSGCTRVSRRRGAEMARERRQEQAEAAVEKRSGVDICCRHVGVLSASDVEAVQCSQSTVTQRRDELACDV